jgi:hypothetical protein
MPLLTFNLGCISGIKRPGREADHIRKITELKNEVGIVHSPMCLYGLQGDNFTFYFTV